MFIENIIIGAGLSGITLSQRLAEKGEKVLLIEKRNHIGGNCYDYYDKNGFLIHAYGPHIFHTNYDNVWSYLNRFTEFTDYQHKVLGYIDGCFVSIPFNINSINNLFPSDFAKTIISSLLSYFNYGDKISIIELREKAASENDLNLKFIADFIFEKVFKNYTIKQWGISAKDINEDVLKRVPILISKDDRYFSQDKYQGMPKNGYTKMFKKMLDNTNIRLMLNTDYNDFLGELKYNKLFFTGPIDEFFNFKYGKLDYKKTLYHIEVNDQKIFQKVAQVNYPNDKKYTRITEFKHFYPDSSNFNLKKTIICKEFPGIGNIDAYPVETKDNLIILNKYKEEAKSLRDVFFIGRLANYKYFNMDQTVKNVLDFKI